MIANTLITSTLQIIKINMRYLVTLLSFGLGNCTMQFLHSQIRELFIQLLS